MKGTRHPSRPLYELSMQHVLMVTLQGRLGFSSGYVWWMAAEEILFWSPEHAAVDDEILLRIDWDRGAALLNCAAAVHSVLPAASTSVSKGRVLYATFELINSWDDDLLKKGLLQANPDLKTYGWGHLPARLAAPRRKAENRLGRKLGQAPGQSPDTEPEEPVAAEPEEPVAAEPEVPFDRLGILPPRNPAAALKSKMAAAARTAKKAPAVPPASKTFHPDDITPEHPEFETRSETDELVPVLSTEGAEREFISGSHSSGGRYGGMATGRGGANTPGKSSGATSRLQALAERLRDQAADLKRSYETEDTAGGTRADGKKGFLRISHFIPGPPHSMLLRISDPAQLRRAVVLDDHGFEIYLRREPGIELGDQVNVLLGLPDGTPLEFSCRVDRVKPRSLRLVTDIPDDFVISSMEMLIEETS